MCCFNCGASIPEIGASTCPNCGAVLSDELPEGSGIVGSQPTFSAATSFASPVVLGGAVETYEDEPEDGPDDETTARFMAAREELADDHPGATVVATLFDQSGELTASVERHPSNHQPSEPAVRESLAPSKQYFRVQGNIGGKNTAFWVQAPTEDGAREVFRAYATQKGWKILKPDGRSDWPKERKALFPAQRASFTVGEPSSQIPSEFLYRDKNASPVELVKL